LHEDCCAGWHTKEGSDISRVSTQKSGLQLRGMKCTVTLTASADLIAAGDVKNTLIWVILKIPPTSLGRCQNL